MADNILFIGWDRPARGREELAVESFNEVVGYNGRLQQEGRIEGFDAAFLGPNGSGLGGFFILRGSAEQIGPIPMDQEFQKVIANAQLVVDGIRVIHGLTGSAIADQMAIYTDAIGRVPQ